MIADIPLMLLEYTHAASILVSWCSEHPETLGLQVRVYVSVLKFYMQNGSYGLVANFQRRNIPRGLLMQRPMLKFPFMLVQTYDSQ